MPQSNKDENIIVQDWILEKSDEPILVHSHSKGHTGGYIEELSPMARSYKVIGTERQLKEEMENTKWRIDEVYEYKVEPKGSYWYKIYNNPEVINKEVAKKLKEYIDLYAQNGNKCLFLRTN